MIDYDEKMKKLANQKKKNDEKIALKIGMKILKDFRKKEKESNKPLAEILGVKKATNSALISYILSSYVSTPTVGATQKNNESSYEDFLIAFKKNFAKKYDAADVLQYADIDQIIQLGVLLSRAIGRPADMAHAEKYLLNSGATIYIQKLGIHPPKSEDENPNHFE